MAYLVMMTLVALGTGGHIGLYIALIFAGESIIPLSFILLIAGIVSSPRWETLISLAIAIVVMSLTKLLLRRTHRRFSIFLATILGVILELPELVISVLTTDRIIDAVLSTIVNAIFTYLAIVALFAVVVKRLRYRLTRDEEVAMLTLFAVVSMGIYNIDILGFRVYYVFMVLLVLVLPMVTDLAPALLASMAFGIGGGLSGQNLELAGIIMLMTATSHLFMHYNKWYSVIATVAIDLVGGMYFNAFDGYDYLHLIALALGVIIFSIVPKKWYTYYSRIYKKNGAGMAPSNYINRNRIDISARINNLACVFGDIEAELTKGEYVLSRKGAKNVVSENIMCSICGECKEKEVCYRALGGDTLDQIRPIVAKAFDTKATLDDVSTFLESRCPHTISMVDMANTLATKYAKTSAHICNVLDNKRILGREIGAVGTLLGELYSTFLKDVHTNTELADRIEEELAIVGVVLGDILVVEGKDGSVEITLVVRDVDKDKKVIRVTLERLFGIRLDKYADTMSEIEGFSTLRFVPRAKYSLTYGIATERKNGSEESGDTYTAIKLSASHIAVGISDGKGSGKRAEQNSQNTINIVENMYKAGFDSDTVLDFANRLLSIRNSEDFSALDVSIFDIAHGNVDFVKLGGVASYIRRASSVDRIEGSALPIGVLDEAEPSIMRRSLMSGDIVVLLSDGVTDALSPDRIEEILMSESSSNVQTLADKILSNATANGASDDTTAIAVKIVKA